MMFVLGGLLTVPVLADEPDRDGNTAAVPEVFVETNLLMWRIGHFPASVWLGGGVEIGRFRFGLAGGYFDLLEDHLPENFSEDRSLIVNLTAEYALVDWEITPWLSLQWWAGPSLAYEHCALTGTTGYESTLDYLMAGVKTELLTEWFQAVYLGPSLMAHFPLGNPEYRETADISREVPWSLEWGIVLGVRF